MRKSSGLTKKIRGNKDIRTIARHTKDIAMKILESPAISYPTLKDIGYLAYQSLCYEYKKLKTRNYNNPS